MKYILIYLLACFISTRLSAQTGLNFVTLQRTWIIDSGSFPDNIVKLKAYEASKDSSRTYSGYEFMKDGTVTYLNHFAGTMLFCGNGSPFIKSGSWVFIKKKYIRLKVTGGYFAAGTYTYDIVYKIASFSNGLLVLKKSKTYKNKRCEYCQ